MIQRKIKNVTQMYIEDSTKHPSTGHRWQCGLVNDASLDKQDCGTSLRRDIQEDKDDTFMTDGWNCPIYIKRNTKK